MGYSVRKIKYELERLKIKTPAGKPKWHISTITSELKNEKYVGDVLLQKYYCEDFLTKKQKVNDNVLPKYFIENDHEAIVDRRTYNVVQEELKKKTRGICPEYNAKIICADCDGHFTRKIWHSNDKYREVVYTCMNRYGKGCKNRHIKEIDIKNKFIEALNELINRKYDIIDNVKIIKDTVCDTKDDEAMKKQLESEMKILEDKAKSLIDENTKKSQDQKVYEKKYNDLLVEYEKKKEKLNETIINIEEKKHKMIEIDNYISTLSKIKVAKWDSTLWVALVDKMVVGKYKIEVCFKDGSVI